MAKVAHDEDGDNIGPACHPGQRVDQAISYGRAHGNG